MQRNTIIALAILVLVVGGLIYYYSRRQPSLTPQLPELVPQVPTSEIPTITQTETPTQTPTETPTVSEVIIRITDSGFEPKEITIDKGTKVTWVNEANFESWPASAVHPTHRVYPGSGIEKCGTPEARNIFDACRGLKKGESWSFVFNEVGEWGYHDHLNPSLKGKIIVK